MALMESFSGIRGIYGTELTDDIAKKYAIVYSQFIKEKRKKEKYFNRNNQDGPKIIIGCDTRHSGSALKNILIVNSNCSILDVSVLPTATIEFAVRYFKADGGIIITASHNEPNYNGFKLLDEHGAILNPEDASKIIAEVHKLKFAENVNEKNATKNKEVKNLHAEARDAYCAFVINLLTIKEKEFMKNSKLKIVIDPNGGTGIISKIIFDALGINAFYVNMTEGKFNRKVEPTKDSLFPLLKVIEDNHADFAAGFDCDADRVELILQNGNLVSGNQTLGVIAKFVLSENQSQFTNTIVVNDATSYTVKEAILPYNAEWIEVEVGEINVVDKMLSTNACIGGEGSNGGIIIPPSRCRDGIITLIYLFKAMAKKNKNLSELLEELPKYFSCAKKLSLKEDFALQKEFIKKYYKSKGFQILETGDETGGLKAIKDNSWVWFRQSKTEDKMLRIIIDTKHKSQDAELMDEAISLVK